MTKYINLELSGNYKGIIHYSKRTYFLCNYTTTTTTTTTTELHSKYWGKIWTKSHSGFWFSLEYLFSLKHNGRIVYNGRIVDIPKISREIVAGPFFYVGQNGSLKILIEGVCKSVRLGRSADCLSDTVEY